MTTAPERADARAPWMVAILTSTRVTLWLVAILTTAMAVATLIPQNASEAAYLKVFGTLLGPVIAKSNLRNLYGSWWFIGGFGLLALNLLACGLQRTGRLRRQRADRPTQITRAQIAGRPQQAQWRVEKSVEAATASVAGALRRSGYAVSELPGEENGQRGVMARRGRLTPWVPVVMHLGMVVVLFGAAWGRLPRNAYQASPTLDAGETFVVQVPDGAIGLRLLDAGVESDRKDQPTDYWAKVEVREEGTAVRTATIRVNHPLRCHGVSVTLQSLSQAGFGVEVSRGETREVMPVVALPDGSVEVKASHVLLQDPPLLVVAEALREHDEQGKEAPAAFVSLGRMSEGGHDFQPIGWVSAEGVEASGVHLRLVSAGSRVTLDLDRDIGIPFVFFGFLLVSLGAVLILGAPRRSIAALVTPRGGGARISVGASGAGGSEEVEKLSQELKLELGAVRETDAPRKEEAR